MQDIVCDSGEARVGILAGLFAAVAAFMLVLSMAVSPSAAQAAPTSFWDVPSGTWYATWVKQAAQAGLMTGMKDSWGNYTGYFEPDSAVTRAQVATVLYRAAGSPSTYASANFKDVYRGNGITRASLGVRVTVLSRGTLRELIGVIFCQTLLFHAKSSLPWCTGLPSSAV